MTAFVQAALPDGNAIDFDTIRADRRRRLFEAMADTGLDALVLGRPNDITFASGIRSLFTTGGRPFSVGCVVVGDRVHVLADHDDGVPSELPLEQLFGRAWNPVNAAAHVAGIPGLAGARRIGVAGASRRVAEVLSMVAPGAELVDVRARLAAVRSPKSAAEVAVIETAAAHAEAALAAMCAALRPGATTRELVARGLERLGELGTPVVPDGYLASRTARGLTAGFDDVPLRDGDLVRITPSVTYAGYDATVGCTLVTGEPSDGRVNELGARAGSALDSVIAACRPGASGAELLAAWAAAGGRPFSAPLVHGIGIGMEEPIVGMGLGATQRLAVGMVLAVQAWWEGDVGNWHLRELVHVTEAGPRRLTRSRPTPEP